MAYYQSGVKGEWKRSCRVALKMQRFPSANLFGCFINISKENKIHFLGGTSNFSSSEHSHVG